MVKQLPRPFGCIHGEDSSDRTAGGSRQRRLGQYRRPAGITAKHIDGECEYTDDSGSKTEWLWSWYDAGDISSARWRDSFRRNDIGYGAFDNRKRFLVVQQSHPDTRDLRGCRMDDPRTMRSPVRSLRSRSTGHHADSLPLAF